MSAEASLNSASSRGLTVRSVFASLLVILVAGVVVTFAAVLDGGNNSVLGAEAVPVPALLAFLPFALALAGVGALGRLRVLTRAELTCVLFASMIATPLLTTGFWRFQLAGLSTVVRLADWTKFEALPDGLWPHGENVLAGALASASVVTTPGGSVRRESGAVTLVNPSGGDPAPGATSTVRLRVLLGETAAAPHGGAAASAVLGRPYLLTALAHPDGLSPGATYFLRLYPDDQPGSALEAASSQRAATRTPLRPDGFVRLGAYALPLPAAAHSVTIELGLRGGGSVTFRAPELCDVSAIEKAYTGFARVTAADYQRLTPVERQGVVVVPDRLLSRAGFRYLLGLDYPLADWLAPVLRLGGFALLVFVATFGLALLFRKQWLENERYALPMARLPLVLLGAEPAAGGLGNQFWKDRWIWLGFALALPWSLLKVARGYYPTLPDPSLRVGLKGYFPDATWGLTWDGVEFKLLVTFVALGLLMELNVLLSLVVGYFAFRLQYWAGMAQGLGADQDFPYFSQQMLGGYAAYGVLLVFATRRYTVGILRTLWRRPLPPGEARVQGAGLILLGLAGVGFVLWGHSLGMTPAGLCLLVGHVLLLAFVAAKFRAECGLPLGAFNHPLGQSQYEGSVAVFWLLPLLGGMSFFGGKAVMVMTLVTAVVLPMSFFSVPGMQVELLEVGRRFGVKPSELGLTALCGVLGGIVIGGWLYLMTLYGFGALRLPVGGEFGDRIGAFRTFNSELATAQAALDAAAGHARAPTVASAAPTVALAFGAISTAGVTLLRQLFPGFWFHPLGLLVGPSKMMTELWGSLLAAYVVRFTVLRLGGARAVRERLVPVAIGAFLAALAAHVVYIAANAHYFFHHLGNLQFTELV